MICGGLCLRVHGWCRAGGFLLLCLADGEVRATVQEHPHHILGKCPLMTFSGQACLQSLIKSGIVGHTQ